MSVSNSVGDGAQRAPSPTTLRASLGGPQRVARGEQQSDISSTSRSVTSEGEAYALELAQRTSMLFERFPNMPFDALVTIAEKGMIVDKGMDPGTSPKSGTPSSKEDNVSNEGVNFTQHEGQFDTPRNQRRDEGRMPPMTGSFSDQRAGRMSFPLVEQGRREDYPTTSTYVSLATIPYESTFPAFLLKKVKNFRTWRVTRMNFWHIYMLQNAWVEYKKQRSHQQYGSAEVDELIATIIEFGQAGEWEMLLVDDHEKKSLDDVKTEKELWNCFYRARISLDLDNQHTSSTSQLQTIVYLLTRWKINNGYRESGGDVGSAKMSMIHCAPLKIILQDLLSYVQFIAMTHPHLDEELLKSVLPTVNQRVTNFEQRLPYLSTKNELIAANYSNHHSLANNIALVVLHLIHREFNGLGAKAMLMDAPYAIVRGAMVHVVRHFPEKGALPLAMFLERVIAYLTEVKAKARDFFEIQQHQWGPDPPDRRTDNYVSSHQQRRNDNQVSTFRPNFQRSQPFTKPIAKQRTDLSLSHLSTREEDPRYAGRQHHV